MRLLWLPDQLREWGLEPIEVEGWRDRGSASGYAPRVFVDHHTAGGSGWAPSLGVVINGRAGIPGPLANLFTPRNPEGRHQIHVVASGKANNAGAGGWHGLSGNSKTCGHERENRGTAAEPWQPWQTEDACVAAAAFLDGMARYEGVVLDETYYAEHKDWAPGRKVDAHTVLGKDQRARVRVLLEEGTLTPAQVTEAVEAALRAPLPELAGQSVLGVLSAEFVDRPGSPSRQARQGRDLGRVKPALGLSDAPAPGEDPSPILTAIRALG